MNSGMVDLPQVVTNPSTNRARRSLTLLMWPTPVALLQTSHQVAYMQSWEQQASSGEILLGPRVPTSLHLTQLVTRTLGWSDPTTVLIAKSRTSERASAHESWSQSNSNVDFHSKCQKQHLKAHASSDFHPHWAGRSHLPVLLASRITRNRPGWRAEYQLCSLIIIIIIIIINDNS